MSDLSSWDNAAPGILQQDDSQRHVECSGGIFLSLTSRILILPDDSPKTNLLEHIYYQYCRDAASDGPKGGIEGEEGRRHWELLIWFRQSSRTLVCFVMLICLASIHFWPFSDALQGTQRVCVCPCVCKKRYRGYSILEWSPNHNIKTEAEFRGSADGRDVI